MAQKKSINNVKASSLHQFCKDCFLDLNADSIQVLKDKYLTANIKKILSDVELYDSLKCLFENNLNISETSRNAFVHRNTLVYRLDKIQKVTFLDARKFEDAVTLYLCMWLNSQN